VIDLSGITEQLELKNMVAIKIEADDGITHKVWEKEGNAFNDDPGVLDTTFTDRVATPASATNSDVSTSKDVMQVSSRPTTVLRPTSML
jgi:hypothetical protein